MKRPRIHPLCYFAVIALAIWYGIIYLAFTADAAPAPAQVESAKVWTYAITVGKATYYVVRSDLDTRPDAVSVKITRGKRTVEIDVSKRGWSEKYVDTGSAWRVTE